MIKRLKFSSKGPVKLWFVSDWHLNHQISAVWEKRGFKSREEHTEKVIEITNQFVGVNDILFNLGDPFLNTTEEMAIECLNKINCQNIYLLWSNHNNPLKKIYLKEVFNKYKEDIEVYPLKWKNLTFVGHYLNIFIDNVPVILSHFPFFTWDFMKQGSFHGLGHEHSMVKELLPDNIEGKRVDLSWEVFGRPINWDEFKNIMNLKQVISHGHH